MHSRFNVCISCRFSVGETLPIIHLMLKPALEQQAEVCMAPSLFPLRTAGRRIPSCVPDGPGKSQAHFPLEKVSCGRSLCEQRPACFAVLLCSCLVT